MKKYITGIIIGILISSSSVFAINYLYNANDVSYDPKDETWDVDNVNSAIGDLYSKIDNNKIFNLGTGTSFNIKQMSETKGNALYGIDWSNLTSDNFIITNLTSQTQYYTGGSGLNPAWSGHPAYVNFTAATKSYNQSTGILTVNNAYAYGYVAGNASWSPVAYAPSTVYLVLGNIISVN